MNKKLFGILGIFILSFSMLGFLNFASAGISVPGSNVVEIYNGSGANSFYPFSPTSTSLFYNVDNERYYAIFTMWDPTDIRVRYAYSDVGDIASWNDGGMIGNPVSASASYGNTHSGLSCSMVYNDPYYYLIVHANPPYDASRCFRGEEAGSTGAINWEGTQWVIGSAGTVKWDLTVDFEGTPMAAGGFIDTSDANTDKILVVFAENDTFYYPHNAIITSEDVGDVRQDAAIIPLGIKTAYVVGGNLDSAAPLYGAVVTNETADPFDMDVITDNAVLTYGEVTGTLYASNWDLCYDDLQAHFVYTDTLYDTYYFSMNLSTQVFSSEEMIFNGTAASYMHSPAITTENYSPFVFFYNLTEGETGTVQGFLIERTGYEEWGSWVDFGDLEYGYTEYNTPTGSLCNIVDDYLVVGYGSAGGEVYVAYATVEGTGIPEVPYFSVTGDFEDIDDEGADWVFTDWKYYNFTATTNMNPTNMSIQFTVPTGEENINGEFWSDGDNWTYASNMTYEDRAGEPFRMRNGYWDFDDETNITTVIFPIWFESRILDVWLDPVDIYYQINASAAVLAQADLFRIYTHGGFEMNLAATGDAGKLQGGTPFSLYANNGSIAYNEIWYRDAQHIKLLPDIHFFTGLEPFYIRYGCDYSLGDGEWLDGWAININPKFVSYTGIFASNVWINMTNSWENRGDGFGSEDLYMFYHGSVTGEGDPGHWQSWVDFWFSDTNASSAGAVRYNAYEFAMIDTADLWLRWLANNWGVKDDVDKEMMMEIPLFDTDNTTIISSERIKMVRFWCELEVDDADAGQYVAIVNYDTFDVTLSQQLPLVGIPSPVFDETVMPVMGQHGILGALWSMFSQLGQYLSENVIFGGLNLWGNFVNFLDTIAGFFGAPTFFSDLFDWLADLFSYLALSAGYIITILGDIFELIGALMVTFLNTMGDIITALVNTFTMISDMLGGAYGTGINIWDALGISTWLTLVIIFYPIYLIILWDSKGMDAVIQQLTWLFGILSWVFHFLISVVQFIINLVGRIIESIPVVE